MTAHSNQPPEPLRSFDGLEVDLARVDAACERYRGMMDAGRILPNSIEAQRVELTYHSNAIEGSTLTLRETALILEGRTPPSGKSLREIYEARNHDRALRLIERWAAERAPSAPLTERDLLDVHAVVLADIDSTHAGRLRSDRVLIKGTRYVPPGNHRIDMLLPEMLRLANRPRVHAVLQAAEPHCNVASVHPFNDGNGRTARLMMNYLLLRRGYPHAVIEVERRAEYLAALEEANAGRCGAIAGFIARCVGRSIGRITGDG